MIEQTAGPIAQLLVGKSKSKQEIGSNEEDGTFSKEVDALNATSKEEGADAPLPSEEGAEIENKGDTQHFAFSNLKALPIQSDEISLEAPDVVESVRSELLSLELSEVETGGSQAVMSDGDVNTDMLAGEPKADLIQLSETGLKEEIQLKGDEQVGLQNQRVEGSLPELMKDPGQLVQTASASSGDDAELKLGLSGPALVAPAAGTTRNAATKSTTDFPIEKVGSAAQVGLGQQTQSEQPQKAVPIHETSQPQSKDLEPGIFDYRDKRSEIPVTVKSNASIAPAPAQINTVTQQTVAVEFSNSMATESELMRFTDPFAGKERLFQPLPTTNVPTAASAIPARQIINQVSAGIAKGQEGVFEIRLSPMELGRITIQIAETNGTHAATVLAERAEVLDLLRRNENLIENEFEAAGFSNLSFEFGDQGQQGAENNDDTPISQFDGLTSVEPMQMIAPNLKTDRLAADLDIRL